MHVPKLSSPTALAAKTVLCYTFCHDMPPTQGLMSTDDQSQDCTHDHTQIFQIQEPFDKTLNSEGIVTTFTEI